MDERWNEIVGIWRTNKWMIGFFGGLGFFVVGFIIGAGTVEAQPDWLTSFSENFWIEAVSILATVLVIDRIYAASQLRERKIQLFNQLKSRANIIAIDALEQIRREDWLSEALQYYKGSADDQPNLRVLSWQGSYLNGIKLHNVDLRSSKFNDADLRNADLQGCDLAFCDLTDAFIGNTDLRGTDLHQATLNWGVATKNGTEATRLPDGLRLTADMPEQIDLGRYTDPQHPQYRVTRDEINNLRLKMSWKPLRD